FHRRLTLQEPSKLENFGWHSGSAAAVGSTEKWEASLGLRALQGRDQTFKIVDQTSACAPAPPPAGRGFMGEIDPLLTRY
ncbi:MAG: hypothetical protein WAL20_14680, partial [Rhodomicrobium sp.]